MSVETNTTIPTSESSSERPAQDEMVNRIILQAGLNHVARAKEGQALLDEGRPLSEIRTPVLEIPTEQVVQSRQTYLDGVKGLSLDEINKRIEDIEVEIKNAEGRRYNGTSELHWRRNVLKSLADN